MVVDYFGGQLLSRVICEKCGTQSVAFDNAWDYALNFSAHDGGDLLKMLDHFTKEESIAKDYYCGKCKGNQRYRKTSGSVNEKLHSTVCRRYLCFRSKDFLSESTSNRS